ncbi:MAG: hypothetical protein KatS3mg110_3187 [Pirellulaceae bacterium]|nr:MAG: hypothetical protein KatS3mg110_3187 [Pirellulaceae bacterium]
MIHYSCDRCGRLIHPTRHVRYVVRIEVEADFGSDEPVDDDHDFLEELDEYLSQPGCDTGEPTPSSRTYDLCADCYAKFIGNPLGTAKASLDFSSN